MKLTADRRRAVPRLYVKHGGFQKLGHDCREKGYERMCTIDGGKNTAFSKNEYGILSLSGR